MNQNSNVPARDELPDATLTRERRYQLRTLANNVAAYTPHLNHHDLMYLAGAFEDLAKLAKERQRFKGGRS